MVEKKIGPTKIVVLGEGKFNISVMTDCSKSWKNLINSKILLRQIR